MRNEPLFRKSKPTFQSAIIGQDLKENLEKAEALRQSILKKAFEGKLLNEMELEEVRSAEDWESAAVLLERVKAESRK